VRYTDVVNLLNSIVATIALVSSVFLGACEGSDAPPRDASRPPPRAAAAREPVFAVPSKKSDYDRARAIFREIDGLRGATMTEALATELAFKCSNLRAAQTSLAGERDPIVWRVRSDIDKTCGFDVPLASALFEIDRIEKKRAGAPDASLKSECLGLRLAIGDIGSAYIENPAVTQVGGKFSAYCEAGSDSVRTVP
jgi:hypothetical protein